MPARRTLLERLSALLRGDRTKAQEPPSEDFLVLEWETYQAHKPGLLKEHEGQWVAVHQDRVLGVRPTYEEALRLGYEQAGYTDFLVHQVLATEPVQVLPPQPV